MNTTDKTSAHFLCIYTPEDTFIHDELILHLSGLRRLNLIGSWHDWKVSSDPASSDEAIKRYIEEADIVLILVSQSLLTLPFIHSEQADIILQRYENGKAHVIPILIHATDWAFTVFGSIQSFPINALPISLWDNRDSALADIAESVHIVINENQALNALNRKAKRLSGGLQQALLEIDHILQDVQQYEQISQQDLEAFEKALILLRSSVNSGLDQFKQLAGE